MKVSRVAAALTALSIAITSTTSAAASPRHAAFASAADPRHAEMRMFAGATLRVRGDRVEPSLALSPLRGRTGEASRVGEGLRLSLAAKPRLTFAGQDAADLKRRQQLSGRDTALVIGGVVVVGLVVVLVAFGEMDDQEIV